jgi:hypothetical protein
MRFLSMGDSGFYHQFMMSSLGRSGPVGHNTQDAALGKTSCAHLPASLSAWKLYCQPPHRTSAILVIACIEGLSSARCSDVLKSGFLLQYQVKTPHTHM